MTYAPVRNPSTVDDVVAVVDAAAVAVGDGGGQPGREDCEPPVPISTRQGWRFWLRSHYARRAIRPVAGGAVRWQTWPAKRSRVYNCSGHCWSWCVSYYPDSPACSEANQSSINSKFLRRKT